MIGTVCRLNRYTCARDAQLTHMCAPVRAVFAHRCTRLVFSVATSSVAAEAAGSRRRQPAAEADAAGCIMRPVTGRKRFGASATMWAMFCSTFACLSATDEGHASQALPKLSVFAFFSVPEDGQAWQLLPKAPAAGARRDRFGFVLPSDSALAGAFALGGMHRTAPQGPEHLRDTIAAPKGRTRAWKAHQGSRQRNRTRHSDLESTEA